MTENLMVPGILTDLRCPSQCNDGTAKICLVNERVHAFGYPRDQPMLLSSWVAGDSLGRAEEGNVVVWDIWGSRDGPNIPHREAFGKLYL